MSSTSKTPSPATPEPEVASSTPQISQEEIRRKYKRGKRLFIAAPIIVFAGWLIAFTGGFFEGVGGGLMENGLVESDLNLDVIGTIGTSIYLLSKFAALVTIVTGSVMIVKARTKRYQAFTEDALKETFWIRMYAKESSRNIIWWRILAWFIDYIIVGLFLGMSIVFVATIMTDNQPELVKSSIAFVALLWMLYYWIMEITVGATLGKLITGLRVMSAKGEKINWKQALVRVVYKRAMTASMLLAGLYGGAFLERTSAQSSWGSIMILVTIIVLLASRYRQRIGDMVADTYVVKKSAADMWRQEV